MNNTDLLYFIKNNHDSLLMVLDLIPKPIFIKNSDGLYLSCNTSFEQFCGFSREQMIGRTVHDLWLPEQADIFHAKDNELLENPGVQQ
ncbi:MAG: PAS domain-containing protein, partial [Proteobacteria bacterium]|nr:PAS domain-containing protein [Pseudomonadota bacterium]